MSKALIFHFFIALMGLLFFPLKGSAPAQLQTFTGKAYQEGGKLAYTEQHDVTYEGDRVIQSRTTYFNPQNRVIGYLESEYTPLPRFCSYTFRDLRNQYEDGVRLNGNQICFFRKKTAKAEIETTCIPREEQQIIGQGFHHFIATHLMALAGGEIFHVKLAMPSRLNQFNFRISKKKTEGENLFIRLEIDNWLLRLLAPHVDVVYERKSGRLMRYEGISNVADASGKFSPVQIVYQY